MISFQIRSNVPNSEVIVAADEVIKITSLKPDQDDKEAQVPFSLPRCPEIYLELVHSLIVFLQEFKKKMEATHDHFAEALYQKGLALAEIESFKCAMLRPFRSQEEQQQPQQG
ncbi:tripeptidyl-peptidase 2-like isoform X1 [Carex rostrata]